MSLGFHCQLILCREKVRHLRSIGLPCEMYFMYLEHTGDHFQALLKLFLFSVHQLYIYKGKGKVIPLQARCDREGGYRYSSTLP